MMCPVLDKTDNLVGQQCAEDSLTLGLTMPVHKRVRLPLMVLLLQVTAHPSQRTVTHHGQGCPTLWWQVTVAWWLRLIVHVGTEMLFTHHQLFSDSNGRPSTSNPTRGLS